VSAVFDSDFLIDFLGGLEAARDIPEEYDRRFISIISFIEVLTGAEGTEEDGLARSFLDGYEMVPVSVEIAERAIVLRRARRRLKTPDALVWATAQSIPDCVLITRNTRDFPEADPLIRIPYHL